MFRVPEKYRVTTGPMRSDASFGNNGLFAIPTKRGAEVLNVIASDGLGWEHVSISRPNRTPTWAEMCKIKSMFWDDEDLVVQMHVPMSEWVNNHMHCLHLWRKEGTNDFCEMPPPEMVGYKELGVLR